MIFVELLDAMGNDLAVVNAARVSMHKESKELSDADVKLIRYLAKHHHWTPFAQVTFKFRFNMPIFVARQWYKHKIGLVENEVSRRYVQTEPEFFVPDYFRPAAENVKQGSLDQIHKNDEHWKRSFGEIYQLSANAYRAALDDGMCPEQARMILPQAMMTEFIQTGSLYAYYNLWKLRTGPHAQKEIRLYAEEMGRAIKFVAPYSWEALVKG